MWGHRMRAAVRAFKRPDLVALGERVARAALLGQQHRVVRHHLGTDALLYPLIDGHDASKDAKEAFLAAQPRYVGETVTWWDGDQVRGQKIGEAP